MKRNIFKAEIIIDDDGRIKVTSYSNRQIPAAILSELNNKVHEAADNCNGDIDWIKNYVHFEHNGVSYKQIEQKSKLCEGCCFYKDNNSGCSCSHPFFSNKPHCTGKIYIVEQ